MLLRRRSCRRATSLIVVLALLFSQMALASYLCPGLGTKEAMKERMAAGLPCDGDDTSTPVLCHQHATNIAQSFEIAKIAAPGLPAIAGFIVLPAPPDAARSAARPFGRCPEAQPPPDPIFLKTLRLRV